MVVGVSTNDVFHVTFFGAQKNEKRRDKRQHHRHKWRRITIMKIIVTPHDISLEQSNKYNVIIISYQEPSCSDTTI